MAGKSTYSKEGGGQPNSMRAYKGGGGVKKAKNRAYVLYGSTLSVYGPVSDADFSLMAARMGCKQFGCAHTVALTTSAVMAEMANTV